MSYFIISASKCPKCGEMNFWFGSLDVKTYEWVSSCDSCGYEERTFDKEAKEDFEFLEKAIKEGKPMKVIRIDTKVRQK